MAATIKVDGVTFLPSGQQLAYGTLTIGNYATGGVVANFADLNSDSFKAAGYPKVFVSPAGGYVFEHNKGTASAGKIKAFYTTQNAINGAVENTVLVEVPNGTSMTSINAAWVAFGEVG